MPRPIGSRAGVPEEKKLLIIKLALSCQDQIKLINHCASTNLGMPSFKIRVALASLFLLVSLVKTQQDVDDPIYCSSLCDLSFASCVGKTPYECTNCARSFFETLPEADGTCSPLSNYQIKVEELQTSSMSLSGYSGSSLNSVSCGSYGLSGSYVKDDYIEKTFVGLGESHYRVIVMFGIGFIGDWSGADQIQVTIAGTTHTQSYSCTPLNTICSSSDKDCFQIYSYEMDHYSDEITVHLTSLITQTDPSIKYWGVKDLYILTKECNPGCSLCMGGGINECLSCSDSFYLHGNICVSSCDKFSIAALRLCVSECPAGYYTSGSSCIKCRSGCAICSDADSCMVEENGSSTETLWEKNFEFWIALIVIGILVGLFVAWSVLSKRYIDSKLEMDKQDGKKSVNADTEGEADEKATKRSPQDEIKRSDTEIEINESSLEQIKVANPQRRKRPRPHMLFEDLEDVSLPKEELTFIYQNAATP